MTQPRGMRLLEPVITPRWCRYSARRPGMRRRCADRRFRSSGDQLHAYYRLTNKAGSPLRFNWEDVQVFIEIPGERPIIARPYENPGTPGPGGWVGIKVNYWINSTPTFERMLARARPTQYIIGLRNLSPSVPEVRWRVPNIPP